MWVVVGRTYKTHIQRTTVHKTKACENKYPQAAVKPESPWILLNESDSQVY